jgi:hypothetical protein
MKQRSIHLAIVLLVLLAVVNRHAIADRAQGAIEFAIQSATPAAAAAGFEKLYPKADGKWYRLNSSGVETEIAAGGGGTSFDPVDMRSVWWRDDFFALVPSGGSMYSDQTWSYRNIGSPSGQAITQGNGTVDNPGVAQIATGTVANTGLILHTDSYNYDHGRFNLRATGQEACVAVALSATTQFKARIGVTLTGEGYNVSDSENKAWFYYNATSTESTWQMRVGAYGGTAGTYDTGVTGDTGFHSACWRTDGTKVYLRWDGGTEHSFCLSGCDTAATVPDGSSNKYSLGFAAITLDTTSKNLLVDFAAYNRTVSTANARKRN